MRALVFVVLVVIAPALGCNQDAAASNPDRDTHMASVRAAASPDAATPSPSASTGASSMAPPAPAAP